DGALPSGVEERRPLDGLEDPSRGPAPLEGCGGHGWVLVSKNGGPARETVRGAGGRRPVPTTAPSASPEAPARAAAIDRKSMIMVNVPRTISVSTRKLHSSRAARRTSRISAAL